MRNEALSLPELVLQLRRLYLSKRLETEKLFLFWNLIASTPQEMPLFLLAAVPPTCDRNA